MAETFGLAVNIATVFDLLVKVGVQCSLYCSGVKSAPREIKYVLDEADRLGTTLRDINQLLNGPNGEKIDSSQNIRRTLEDVERQLKDLADKLKPGPTWKRLVWPLKKGEVAAITERLGQGRSAISFDLQVYQACVSHLVLDMLLMTQDCRLLPFIKIPS
jgi:DNA-binding transcriptional MerR regulator